MIEDLRRVLGTRRPIIVWSVFFTVFLAACSPRQAYFVFPNVEGTIRESGSPAPIAGVRVLVHWEATFGKYGSACTWVAAAETDSQGKFTIAAPASKMKAFDRISERELTGGLPRVRLYKRGMTLLSDHYETNAQELKDSFGPLSRSAEPIVATVTIKGNMVEATGAFSDRVQELLKLSRPLRECSNYDDVAGITRFYEGIAAEAIALAATEYDKQVAATIAARARRPAGPIPNTADDDPPASTNRS